MRQLIVELTEFCFLKGYSDFAQEVLSLKEGGVFVVKGQVCLKNSLSYFCVGMHVRDTLTN